MSLIPNFDIAFIETETLTSVPTDGVSFYEYVFDNLCVGSTATTTISICNLTANPLIIEGFNDGVEDPDFSYQDLTGLYIPPYSSYTYNWVFIPTSAGYHYRHFDILSGDSSLSIHLTGYAFNSLIDSSIPFTGSSCFIDYGTVGANSYISVSANFHNITSHNIPISFSGDLISYTIMAPDELLPGNNTIEFIFNPQNVGSCTESVILQGDCQDYLLTFCGFSIMGNSISLAVDTLTSYIGCCSYPALHVYNNHMGYSNNSITVTNITYPGILTTEQTFPIYIDASSCAIVEFDFCPTVSGLTAGVINVEYTYEYGGTMFTGYSEIDIVLSAFTHPFSTVNTECLQFHCANYNTETALYITNPGNQPFQFYYLFVPNNTYDFYNIFETDLIPPIVIPPFATTGITIDFNSIYLTTGSSFSNLFNLKLIDPVCCKELTKCINVSFCPTTVSPNLGYPVNVNCYGGCDGQYSFTVNDCSGEYHIIWSSDTQVPIVSEIETCRLLTEDGLGCIGAEGDYLLQYYDQISATNLLAGNYLLTITNACNETIYHPFSITQPDPLFVSIHWLNPNNYCKSDLSGLCGIVPSPNINPSGYVVLDKETLIKVINNDLHDIPGQEKRGLQQYDARENQIAQGQPIDGLNSFRSYILDFFSGAFANYKTKIKKEEQITVKAWDEIVAETIGNGCCFSSYVSGGTPPYSYQWFGPNNYTAISPNIFDRPCCEPYTLVITDAHGCTVSATSVCLQCSFGIEELIITSPTCKYSEDGEIFVALSGNCPDAIYQIELEGSSWLEIHTASTYNFINLGADNYTLRVENLETECKIQPIHINLQSKYEFGVSAQITGASCIQACDGIIEILVNTAQNIDHVDPEFIYTLDGHGNYSNSPRFTGVCAGEHTISVMNTLNYCEVIEQIVVPNLGYPTITTQTTPASSQYASDGTITIIVDHAVSCCIDRECYALENADYVTDDYTTFFNHAYTINNVHPGTYQFCLTDCRGCNKCFTVIVEYELFKKRPNKPQFDSRRSDSYSGSKITSNTPKGQ